MQLKGWNKIYKKYGLDSLPNLNKKVNILQEINA